MAMGFQPVVSLWRHRAAKAAPVRDWTQDELAQFYRVEWALGQAGISVETERGLTDEGDPWFAFCKAPDGDVVIHIAREGPVYVLAGVLSGGVQRGRDFTSLVEQLLAQHPAKSIDRRGRGNVVMHPATMLALLVSIAILQSGGESKAETGDGDAASPLMKQHGAVAALSASVGAAPAAAGATLFSATAGRVSQATAASPTPLIATLEVSQAMSILMVASLATQEPARASTLIRMGDGESMKLAALQSAPHARGPLTASGHSSGKDAAAAAAGGQNDIKSLAHGEAGIEKLLEIVAKLWTMPAAAAVSAPISVESALAFFRGDAAEPTAAMAQTAPQPKASPAAASAATAEKAASPQVAQAAAVEPAAKEVRETKPAAAETKPAETKETVQIVHTPAGSETTAQTVLKLTVAHVKEMTVETGAASDSGKLLAAVSEIVSLAKATQSLDSAKSALGRSLDLDLTKPSARTDIGRPDDSKSGRTEDVRDSAAKDKTTDAAKAADIATTTVKTGMIKHEVLDDGAIKTTIDRAVAAFYEDVPKVSVAITGKDIIYYSADAVINHSTEVVVELWQFKDGSSISLVGLSHDGALPYSL